MTSNAHSTNGHTTHSVIDRLRHVLALGTPEAQKFVHITTMSLVLRMAGGRDMSALEETIHEAIDQLFPSLRREAEPVPVPVPVADAPRLHWPPRSSAAGWQN